MINNASRTGQAFWLGIGSLISFSFGIISAAILSRFLSIDEYGTYRQVLYVYSTLLIVFTLGMPRAYSFFLARIPIEQGRKTINKINSAFLLLGAIFSFVLFCCSDLIGQILNNHNLPSAIRYFSLTPVFLLPVLGLESIMATYKRTRCATIYIILTRIFNLICIVLPVVFISPTANTAVIGFSISSALCCVVGLIIERKPFHGISTEPSGISIKEIFKYSLPLLIASLWAIVINSSPQFFISRWYGTDTFAEFANGFMELPFAGMIIGAVSTVLLPEISRLSKDKSNVGQVLDIWRSSYEKSAKIIYPLAVFACIFAPQIMLFIYGDKYAGAAVYFRIIVVINLVRVVPYAPVLMGLNLVRQYALANIVPAFYIVLVDLIWVYISINPFGIAVLQCSAIVFHVAMMLYYISRHTHISLSQLIPWNFSLKLIVISAFTGIVSQLFVIHFLTRCEIIVQLITGGMIFFALFLLIAIPSKLSYKEMFHSLLKKNA